MYNLREAREIFKAAKEASPTWSEQFYANLYETINKGKCGIFSMHFVPDDTGSEAAAILKALTELGFTATITYDKRFNAYELATSGWAEEGPFD